MDALRSDLKIPPEFSHHERFDVSEDAALLERLESFKRNATRVLEELRDLLEKRQDELATEDSVEVVFSTTPFIGVDDPWISAQSRKAANEILNTFHPPSIELIEIILSTKVKPLFQANPHPRLNTQTGRKLPQIAGGSMAGQDYYEDQVWKTNPGVANVLLWCVMHLDTDSYERLWHLIIPPVMTLLDDYQPTFKARGAEVVRKMLLHIPKTVLKRTGIDSLLATSLLNCLAFIENDVSGRLIKAAIHGHLSLTFLSTEPGSAERFEQICALLGEGIIGRVWTYCMGKQEPLLATTDALPDVLRALDIGTARYLKAIIPQLVQPLQVEILEHVQSNDLPLRISCVQSLICIMEVCSPRIRHWKGRILEGLGKCWVIVPQSGEKAAELRVYLRKACETLARVCPVVVQEEYRELVSIDAKTFSPLVSEVK